MSIVGLFCRRTTSWIYTTTRRGEDLDRIWGVPHFEELVTTLKGLVGLYQGFDASREVSIITSENLPHYITGGMTTGVPRFASLEQKWGPTDAYHVISLMWDIVDVLMATDKGCGLEEGETYPVFEHFRLWAEEDATPGRKTLPWRAKKTTDVEPAPSNGA